MTSKNVKLGDQPFRLVRDLTLLKNEKCIVTVSSGILSLPILVDDSTLGHFFLGKGQLTLDAIVETPQGAVGKPLVKDFNRPLLMFGGVSNVSESLVPAAVQDVSNMGYERLEDFVAEANDVLNRFIDGRHTRFDFEEGSYLFALANDHGKWDVLVSKGDRVVYASRDKVFISDDKAHSVMVHPAHVLVAKEGKTVVIGKNNILIDRDKE